MIDSLKKPLKDLILSTHHVIKWLNPPFNASEPFLCVITPVFDGAIESIQLLVHDLQKQSFKNFSVVFISNGTSNKIKKYVEGLSRTDKRFLYSQIKSESIKTQPDLLCNLGKRRNWALRHHAAKRYVFLDADIKILDNNYFSKLFVAHQLTRKDIICTQVVTKDSDAPLLPIFPVGLGRIDMSNFTFSKRVAKSVPYPSDFDPKFGMGNDFRFFSRINTANNTLFLNFVSARRNGNNKYATVSEFVNAESGEMISVFGNSFDYTDITNVASVLQSHLVGRGTSTTEFERRFAKKIGFVHAAAVHSCTNAFWLLLKSLNLKKEDEVIIPNIHFYGIRNVLELLQIKYRVCDVDPIIPNISLEHLRPLINEKTKVIIFLEYGGFPIRISKIKKYLREIHRNDIFLVLDAANSPFTKVKNRYSSLDYDFSLYSFDMNKILVTGDGGMVLSNNKQVIESVKSLASWGITNKFKTALERSKQADHWWEVSVKSPGMNMEMNNIAGALGLSQLQKMKVVLERRKIVDKMYRTKLKFLVEKGLIKIPDHLPSVQNDLYMFWILVETEKIRDALAAHLVKANIYCTVRYQLLDPTAKTPNAKSFYSTSLCLPFHQNLNPNQLDLIVGKMQEFFSYAK